MKFHDSECRPDPARIEELFHAAAELPTSDWMDFLASACGPDTALREAVRSLLDAKRSAWDAWEISALALEARHSAFDARPIHPGEFFGPYRILRRVAAGGMSFVYEAVRDDSEFHKRVAIKFVQQDIGDAAAVKRFRSERQILAELEHPYIARLLDGGTTDDGVPYLVMEYVDGLPIDKFARQQRLPRAERLKLFLQVCEAVQYAHRNLVVHRDLKPGNILVSPDGEPKLLDFGIAKLMTAESETNTLPALTPEYASPEQVLGRSIGTATDIYSLGVLLFVLLAERLPYQATAAEPAELVRAILQEDPLWKPAGLIDEDLQSILAKALCKEPDRRYLSVEQFAADLRRYLNGLPVEARPDSFLYRARKFVARRAIPLAAICGVLLAVLLGVLSTAAQSRRVERRFNEVRSLAHSVLFDVYDSVSALPASVATRHLVASHAQKYLDSLAREAADDSILCRDLAESYVRLGDVLGSPYSPNLGDTAGALENYRKAQALLEREAVRHPHDAVLAERLSEVYLSIGRVLERQRKIAPAVDILRRSIAVAEMLFRRSPLEPKHRLRLSRAYSYLAETQQMTGDQRHSLPTLQAALATSMRSVDILESAGQRADDEWRANLSARYFRVGYALWALGDQTSDPTYYWRALQVQLKGDAINRSISAAYPRQSRRMADGLLSIGLSRWKCCGDFGGAMRDFEEALKPFQQLADADPHDVEARRDLGNAYDGIGVVLEENGRRADALKADRQALAIFEELARADPSDRENDHFLSVVRTRLAAFEAK